MADAGDVAIEGADTAANHDRIGPRTVVAETVPEAKALYVSIDLDVLDPSVAPGLSLPEVARRGRVIGFDVVELNPARDPAGTTARVAAWTAVHFLSEILDPAL